MEQPPPGSLEELRADLVRAVRRICPAWLADCADDLVQVALLKVMEVQRKSEGKAALSSFYLQRVARSALIDEIRRRRRRPEVPLDEAVESHPAARQHAREDSAVLASEKARVEDQLAHLHARPGDPFATLASVRRHLGPRDALLSFQVAPWTDWTGDFGGGTWLVVVTRDAPPRAFPLERMGRPELRHEVEDFVAILSPGGTRRIGSRRERALAADLYGKLLAPALAGLPKTIDRLLVVPDDELHRLPFGALQASPGGPPLARRYDISLAPSATLWLGWRESPPSASPGALALADPPLPSEAARRRLAESGVNLPDEPLPFAEEEAASAMRYVGGEEHVGAAVSKPGFLHADLSPFGLLLFATYAVVDEHDPEGSGIWLSPGRGRRGDGLLRMPEIAGLRLDGRAVGLSACSTAGGRLFRGEGVLSLARAFFQARASTVVASLWPQWDDASAELFDRFYYHLGEGKSLATALAAAQRDRMDEGAPPAAWAGFVVLGDGDRVPFPGGRSRLALALIRHSRLVELAAAAAILALAALAAVRLRRRAAQP